MNDPDTMLMAAQRGDAAAFGLLVEPHRKLLRGLAYRISGSIHDADDLLQDALLKAWKGIGTFEARSSLKTWLTRIVTFTCLDALEKKSARTLPFTLGPPASATDPLFPRDDITWLEPYPDDALDEASPEALISQKQSVGLAFLTTLQVLPPKQRVVLVLRDVLGWQAKECADLLDLSVASVNSALQRARDTLAQTPNRPHSSPDDEQTKLLQGYVSAWERADVPQLVALLRDDAVLAMPPLSQWLQGAQTIGASLRAMVLPPEARGVFRLVPLQVNGLRGFAAYRRDGAHFVPASIHVLEIDGGRISKLTAFLDTRLFAKFGLLESLPG